MLATILKISVDPTTFSVYETAFRALRLASPLPSSCSLTRSHPELLGEMDKLDVPFSGYSVP